MSFNESFIKLGVFIENKSNYSSNEEHSLKNPTREVTAFNLS